MPGFGYALGFSKKQVLKKLGLLDTGASNLLTFSQAFDNVAWTKTSGSVVANDAVAPDDTTTAEKFIPAAAAAIHTLSQGGQKGSGTFTFSAYVKTAGYPRMGLRVYDGTAYRIRVTFDISNGTIVSTEAGSASITPVGNGWYFCSCSGTSASGNMGTTTGWVLESLPAGSLVQASFTGDGTSGMHVWQAQVVVGSSPGPIIWG